MQGSANLNLMLKAVRRAGRSLARDFREVENLQGTPKGQADFVAKARDAAEAMLSEDLRGTRTTYGWLSEAAGNIAGEDPTRRWIVAPLDGALNFQHGLPHWALSVALEHKGDIVAAVLLDPAQDELFWAEKGAGAWMNEGRLRVSGRGRLTEAVVATGLAASARGELLQRLQELARLVPACAGVRHWGAMSLALAWVASGRFDGCWERHLQPWQTAAGVILLREAGGFIEPIRPGEDLLAAGEVLAANPYLFAALAAEVRN